MLLEDQANLREVIAFPLNQAARDLLMGAPKRGVPRPVWRSCICGSCRPAGRGEEGRVDRPSPPPRAIAAPSPAAPVGSSGTSALVEGRIVPFLDPLWPII